MALSARSPGQDDTASVAITLRPVVQLASPDVALADVATLEGGDAKVRERLEAIDLAQLSISAPSEVISREQITFRLRLAGFEQRQFRFEGAGLVHARWEFPGREPPASPYTGSKATPSAEEAVLVKAGGAVRLIARVGPLRLETVGEALQDGKSGQVIRVRNVDSHTVVTGKVVQRSLVEVQY